MHNVIFVDSSFHGRIYAHIKVIGSNCSNWETFFLQSSTTQFYNACCKIQCHLKHANAWLSAFQLMVSYHLICNASCLLWLQPLHIREASMMLHNYQSQKYWRSCTSANTSITLLTSRRTVLVGLIILEISNGLCQKWWNGVISMLSWMKQWKYGQELQAMMHQTCQCMK